jgi:hypothetical protein
MSNEPALSRCLSGAFLSANPMCRYPVRHFSKKDLSNPPLNGEEYHTEITRAACPRYTSLAEAKNSKGRGLIGNNSRSGILGLESTPVGFD